MDTQKTAESCTQGLAHYQITCLSTSMPGEYEVVPILGASFPSSKQAMVDLRDFHEVWEWAWLVSCNDAWLG